MSKTEPFQYEFRKELVKKVVDQLCKGETCALVGMPGVGKSNSIHWIRKRLKQKKQVLEIYLDLNDLSIEKTSLFKILLIEIANSISENIKNPEILDFAKDASEKFLSSNDSIFIYNAVKKIISKLISFYPSLNICIIFNGFEKLKEVESFLYNSLLSIRSIHKFRVSFLFSGNFDLESTFPPSHAGDLYALLNYNKFWIGLLNKKETYSLITEFTSLLDLKNSQKDKRIKNKIWEASQGHAWLIKVLTKVFYEDETRLDVPIKKLSTFSNVSSRIKQIWASLNNNQKNILFRIAGNDGIIDTNLIPEYLTATGLLNINNNKATFFSPIFEGFIKTRIAVKSNSLGHYIPKKGLFLDKGRRIVFKNGKKVKDELTKKEFTLLSHFFDNESSVITRSDVADILWGNKSDEKYSDWAIDKVVSRIRDKIETDSQKPKHLVTLRGVGFRFKK